MLLCGQVGPAQLCGMGAAPFPPGTSRKVWRENENAQHRGSTLTCSIVFPRVQCRHRDIGETEAPEGDLAQVVVEVRVDLGPQSGQWPWPQHRLTGPDSCLPCSFQFSQLPSLPWGSAPPNPTCHQGSPQGSPPEATPLPCTCSQAGLGWGQLGATAGHLLGLLKLPPPTPPDSPTTHLGSPPSHTHRCAPRRAIPNPRPCPRGPACPMTQGQVSSHSGASPPPRCEGWAPLGPSPSAARQDKEPLARVYHTPAPIYRQNFCRGH